MINKILFLMIFSLPIFSASGGETDIVQRVFNFVIFAYILYYLLYDRAVAFLKERSETIDTKLKESQRQLEDLQKEEKISQENIAKAEEKSVEILEDAKNTANMIEAKIKKDTISKLEDLEKSYENKVEVANKKASAQVVKDVLDDSIFPKSIDDMSQDVIVDLINKKVA